MKIDIEDFSSKVVQNTGYKHGDQGDLLSEIELLRKEIGDLKLKLKQQKEESFQEGYQAGRKEGYEQAKLEYEDKLREIDEKSKLELDEKLKDYINKLDRVIRSFQDNYKNILDKTIDLISDSLVEILEFVYLKEESFDIILQQINTLIDEFYDYEFFVIKVGNENLYRILKDKYDNVEIDENLEGLDFIVDFREFKIENRIKEKLEILKDEVEREIKKLSEV